MTGHGALHVEPEVKRMMQVNQRNRWCQIWREQRGSQALEASGVAVGAALVAVALLLALQLITLPGMQRTLDCAVAIVLGGSGCAGADGVGGGAGTQFGADTPSTSDAPSGARTAASIGLDVIPVVGEIKGLIEVFTGTDLVTGEDLGWWRFAGLAGLVGLNEIKLLRHGDEVVDLVRRGDDVLDTGSNVGRRADDAPRPCRGSTHPRKKGPGLAAPLIAGIDDCNLALRKQRLEQLADSIGQDFKNSPLRIEYEAKVAGLAQRAEDLKQQLGTSDQALEQIAKQLWQERRDLGVQYKHMTPEPLRDYIYEMNIQRYNDPLGISWADLELKYKGNYDAMIQASARPNPDINKFLSGFREWLLNTGDKYLD